MVGQNWEYCELRLDGFIQHGGLLFPGNGTSYDCSLRYYVPDGPQIYVELSKKGNILPYNPFTRATAFLGVNGWELVSVQVGNDNRGSELLDWGKRVAFFKRPIVAGRKVNEPELKF